VSENPESRVCIAAIMKNEQHYALEWVAWHRLLGFEVMIADHGGDDGQTALLMGMDAAGLIRRIDVRAIKVRPQIPAYHAMFHAAHDAGIAYLGFLDADEFFEPLKVTTWSDSGADLVRHLFAKTRVAAIAFNWMNFGSSHLTEPSSEPVTQRFIRAAPEEFKSNRVFKSFLDLKRCKCLLEGRNLYGVLHPHGPRIGDENYSHDGTRFRSGHVFNFTDSLRWRHARIRHYRVKTLKEFMRDKVARGSPANELYHYDFDYFQRFDRNDVEAPLAPEILALLRHEMSAIESKLATANTTPERQTTADTLLHRHGTILRVSHRLT
jgi:Glycosyl transferase family 2